MPALGAMDPADLEAKVLCRAGFLQLDPKMYNQKTSLTSKGGNGGGVMEGTVVSPTAPRDKDGTFWGYKNRLALLINAIFAKCLYEGGYDLRVGTSKRGDVSIDDPKFRLEKKRKEGENKSWHGSGSAAALTRTSIVLITCQ
jgi:hypothetical protein